MSHLPILLPGFEIEEVSCGENAAIIMLERPTQEPVVRLVVRLPHEFIGITCARPTMYQGVAVQFTFNFASGAFAVGTTTALAKRSLRKIEQEERKRQAADGQAPATA